MDNYWDDDQVDAMFEDDYIPREEAPPAPQPVQLYPLALAQAPQPNGAVPNGMPQPQPGGGGGLVGLITRPLGPLPFWAWALIAGGVGSTGYLLYKNKTAPTPNGSSDGDGSSSPSVGDVLMNAVTGAGASSGWAPSRSRFAEQLQRYYAKKGHSEHATVWHDAEDAKKHGGLSQVSPLVNVQVKGGGVKVDTALTRFARREGLNPVQHSDGSIGLYPHSTKRGKEWEAYIDALRDEGQSI
jgi:hypothetical protein